MNIKQGDKILFHPKGAYPKLMGVVRGVYIGENGEREYHVHSWMEHCIDEGQVISRMDDQREEK